MSDEFDKEAERERLREKYANEEAERASTKHMSELLLQGAKMTDKHCPVCGTPLFDDGEQTFCPECERQVVDEQESTSESNAVDPTPPPTEEHHEQMDGHPRKHLELALERAAAAAAETSDPRQAKAHLEAARAAIEALNALDESA